MKRLLFLLVLFFCIMGSVEAAYSDSVEYLYVGETFITTGSTCIAQTNNVTAELNAEGKCVIKANAEGEYSVQLEYIPVEGDVATESYLNGQVLKDKYVVIPEMIEMVSNNSKTTEMLKEELMSVSYLPTGATDVFIVFDGLNIDVSYNGTSYDNIDFQLTGWYVPNPAARNVYGIAMGGVRNPAYGGPALPEIMYDFDMITRVVNKLDLYLIEASPSADIAYEIITNPEKYALIKDVYENEIRPQYLVVNSSNSSTSASLTVSFTLDGRINEKIIAEYVKASDFDNTNDALNPSEEEDEDSEDSEEKEEDEVLEEGPQTGAFTEYYVWISLTMLGLILLPIYNRKKIIKL